MTFFSKVVDSVVAQIMDEDKITVLGTVIVPHCEERTLLALQNMYPEIAVSVIKDDGTKTFISLNRLKLA